MKESKAYTSVVEMVRDLQGDEVADKLQEHIDNRKITKALTILRVLEGKKQSDVAKAMGCEQNRISRIENNEDGNLRLTDIVEYLKALDMELVVEFKKRNE
jgi:predicted XRE-type DNA-binding protein